MTILAFCNHKGGTGKTTSVINIAAAFGMRGARVLVIDLDPQGFLSRMVGVDDPLVEASSLMLFTPEVPLREVPVQTTTHFDLLPSSTRLTRLLRKLNRPIDVFWAKEALQQGMPYDVVIFDTAAALTVYSLNAMVAADGIMIPVTPEYQSVIGAEQAFRTARMVKEKLRPDLVMPLFLFTQVDARKRDHMMFRHYIRTRYKGRTLRSIIRTSTDLASTHADGTTVYDHAPTSRGALDYANATEELWNLMLPDYGGMQDMEGAAVTVAPRELERTEEWPDVVQFLGKQET